MAKELRVFLQIALLFSTFLIFFNLLRISILNIVNKILFIINHRSAKIIYLFDPSKDAVRIPNFFFNWFPFVFNIRNEIYILLFLL